MREAITMDLTMSATRNEAVTETFQKEKKRLLGFIKKRVSDKDDAEDILQDVFYQFAESFSPIEPIEKISSWLFRVARNKIIDRYRKKKPEPISQFQTADGNEESSLNLLNLLYDPHDNSDEVYSRSLFWDALTEALESLPEEQKQVFVWHELEGKDFKEISSITEVPVNTLISRKRYAVLHLREQLKYLYDELSNN